ncbi:hypothetical protein [Nitratifractor salsuginis]|uniref:Uncharacterized protein n=1 Tax=Nitratifractor salsuginis (strain DSM 16511 / JCM 12458 / E9I37-1) TaxID=749222 RepID=E6X0G3_NITSE|nr:hypothetical protein [Nitratifractor salsuginis]ADV46813.1 hypothetical protein Nitsa_1565 [Nitratifractor salsuginis DSM 16511]
MLSQFFRLEGAYLVLAGIILLITLYVSTRPFMSKGAPKKALFWVGLVLILFIGGHYWVTSSRIAEVKAAFEQGKPILCESRAIRTAAQSIEIRKGIADWHLEGDNFVSPQYVRPFSAARCIVKKSLKAF